jgi:Peptidase family M23/Bacterial pre-peptidase C-terminal domain
MKQRHMLLISVTVFICLFLFSLPTVSSTALSAEPVSTNQPDQAIQNQVEMAILEKIASNDHYIQKGLVPSIQVTSIKTSNDLQQATAWVTYYDFQVEAVLPIEPGLALAQNIDGKWQVYLPSDPAWQNEISLVPDELLTQSEKEMWLAMNQGTQEAVPTQSGYFLPWHGGLTGYLSRSVGHDADYSTSHYAFDFYFTGNTICTSGSGINAGVNGQNFSIYASKAGTVWGWKDSVANCDHSDVNFIVIRNSDDPTIFQLYMHLSQDSIPPALKTVGAPVARGQFIALADNTGNSTGSHLHFQIEHQPYWPTDNPYWNTSLSMTFDDVDINGGRPRVSPLDPPYCRVDDVCDVFRSNYVSNNYYQGDSTPPTGDISGVSNGAVVSAPFLSLSGWGSDSQSGLAYGQLIASFDGSWHNLGDQFNPTFNYTWDLCNPQLSVTNGPVSVALLLYDVAGNPAPRVGLRTFTKNYDCPIPPPSCLPGSDQITLFEDPGYKGGCVKFNVGDYSTHTTLNPLGDNDAESILIGSNAIATLFSEDNFSGHSQAFLSNTGFMKYQWVSANSLSSLRVSTRSTLPQASILVSPVNSSVFRQGDAIPISWRNGGAATEYQVEIYLNGSIYRSLTWQSAPVAFVDSLQSGNYTWRVQSRNASGTSGWSASSAFSIESPIVIPTAETVPYSDTMETTQSKWISSTNGYWTYQNNSSKAHSGTHSWWYQNSLGTYDDNSPNSGTLTSPPISITSVGYYLRFYYRNQTETQGKTWDQRWVQISVDGGPFLNLEQIYDDPQMPETSSWMRNKAINLSAYSGHTIRVRFQFAAFDAADNNYPGWGIDDFSITATPPLSCSESRSDDTSNQAYLLTYDPTINVPGSICPNGDYDYYKFYGTAGDQVVADVDAMINGSLLDAYLFLIDTDGTTVLAENDDEVYSQRRDPLLSYRLTANGFYYLKLKAWKHPLVGGNDYFYTIRLYEDHVKPVASLTWPPSNSYLPDAIMTLAAQANDVANGVNRVEFYWHPTDWLVGVWEKLGTDWDSADGWSLEFNPAGEPEGNTAAFFIQVFDKAGNWTGMGAWNLGIDKTAPTTAMLPLAASQPSNAFLLEWTGSDNLSGIDHFNIQQSVNNGGWTTLPAINGNLFKNWVIGNPSTGYAYRMQGVDRSGNTENYPASAETSTTIPAPGILCFAPDTYDTSGNDNSPANASVIYLDGPGQFHNFCNPLVPGFQNDEDWIRLNPILGHRYFIINTPSSLPSATMISLFAQDGSTLLAQSFPQAFGSNSILGWTADRAEPVYIRLTHMNGQVIGKDVGGTLSVKTGYFTYFPLVRP